MKKITGRLIAQSIKKYPQTRNGEWNIKVLDDPPGAWTGPGG